MNEQRRTWDPEAYRRLSAPQQQWGLALLSGLTLRGDETVVDAGCGTGALTRLLAEAVPRGRVIALDVSPSMLDAARRELADLAPRVEVRAADLASLNLEREADLIFSAATLHWVLEQDVLYHNLFRALVPGGALRAQCGGRGNLERILVRTEAVIRRRWPTTLTGWSYPAHFAGTDETANRLFAAGFEHIDVALVDAPTAFNDATVFREFVGKVVLTPMLARLPIHAAREEVLDEVVALAESDPHPLTLDYVRLNVSARRPGRFD